MVHRGDESDNIFDATAAADSVFREPVEDVLLRIRRYDVDELAEWLETGKLDRSRLDP